MSPDLSDSDLERELRRRAEGVRLRQDWARIELLAAVRTSIDSRPQPLTGSRLSPLAGIAAVAAVVVLLVVALPRMVPAPGATTEPSPSADPGFVVLSTHDFAARLAAGDLDGATVLVEGRIVQYDGPVDAIGCSPLDDSHCFIGQLDGVERLLGVTTRYVAVPEGEGEPQGYGPEAWSWWHLPAPPVEGILVLSVQGDGPVEYMGRVKPASDGLTWSAGEASEVDLESLALDEIVLVDGWLTGLGGLISGQPPQPGTFIGGLPQRYSGNPAWVLDERVVLDPNYYQEPEGGIRVQNGAYYEFAPNPALVDASLPSLEPRDGTYALTRRLEGGGCPNDSPPCWQWNVVGGLTPDSPQAPPATPEPSTGPPSPTTPAGTRFECVGPPVPPESTPPPVPLPVVIDETGLIVSCAQTDFLTELTDEINVSNPFSADAIEVIWEAEPCDSEMVFTFSATDRGYELVGERRAGPCLGPVPLPLYIIFSRPMPAESIDAAILAITNPTTASPTPLAPQSPGISPPPATAPTGAFEDGLLMVTTEDPQAAAEERLESLLGIHGCIGTTSHDREILPRTFIEWADAVEGEGLTENGWGWVGDWQDAARAFGAFEIYRSEAGESGVLSVGRWRWTEAWIVAVATGAPWLTLGGEDGLFAHPMPPGALIVADLTGVSVGSRTLWIPALTGQTVGITSCEDGVIEESTTTGPVAEDSSGDFTLSISATQPRYEADAPIDVDATITYNGERPSVTLSGGPTPQVVIEQLDGPLILFDSNYYIKPCTHIELERYGAISGSAAPPRPPPGDRNWAFYEEYLYDGQLRLPAGTYKISATSAFSVGSMCSRERLSLTASIVVQVR